MTMPDVARRAGPFTGNGVLTQLPFTFQVQEAADVAVWTYSTVTGLSTPLLLNIGFGVTLNSDQISNPGGVVGLVTPLATGLTATVVGGTAFEQPLRIPNMSSFYPEALTAELDKLTIITQILREALNYTVRVPEGSGIDALTYLQTLVNNTVPVVGTAVAVASISALRANTDATVSTVNVLGYYGAGTPGGGAFVKAPADTTSTDNGGTIIVDAGNRRWYRQGDSLFSVKYFGARGDGVTDDTTQIQAAINAAQLIGGGEIVFSPGRYRITGTINVNGNGVRLSGASRYAAELIFANGALDCIKVEGAAYNNMLTGFQMENLKLTFSGKTNGRTLLMNYAYRCSIHNVQVEACWTGFEIATINDVYIENVEFQGITGGANIPSNYKFSTPPEACYGIWWHAPGDGTEQSIQLTTINVVINCLYSGADALVWDGFATTWNAYCLTALDSRYGMHIKNSTGSVAYFPQFADMDNFNTDGMSSIGLFVEGGTILQFVNSNFQNTSAVSGGNGGADTNAIKILKGTGSGFCSLISFIGGRVGSCKQSAIVCGGRSVVFQGLMVEPGSTQAANTFAAIRLIDGAQDITITGCHTGVWGQPVSWRYGLQLDPGVVRVVATGNVFTQAATREVLSNASDSQSIFGPNISSQSQTLEPAFIGAPATQTVSGGYTIAPGAPVAGIYVLSGAPGAGFTATMPTAAALVAATQNAVLGKTVPLMVINATGQIATIAPGTGTALAGNLSGGNFTIPVSGSRQFMVRLNATAAGSESVTVYG